MLRVAIIILNWNDAEATIACADSVLEEMKHCDDVAHSQLWIVDNGSQHQTVATLKAWIDNLREGRVSFVENLKNVGFSGGMNKGILSAIESGPFDYFWLLNNDLTVEPGALAALVRSAMEDAGVAIWGSTVVDEVTGRVQCAGGCRYNRWIGKEKPIYAGMHVNQISEAKSPKLDYIFGAAMFIRGDVLVKLNGLDESYFLFYEELDLVARLQQDDKLAWCTGSVVWHKGGGSFVTKADKVFSAYHAALSAYKFTWKYHPACLPTVLISRILGLTINAVRYRNPQLASAPLKALKDFFWSDS